MELSLVHLGHYWRAVAFVDGVVVQQWDGGGVVTAVMMVMC